MLGGSSGWPTVSRKRPSLGARRVVSCRQTIKTPTQATRKPLQRLFGLCTLSRQQKEEHFNARYLIAHILTHEGHSSAVPPEWSEDKRPDSRELSKAAVPRAVDSCQPASCNTAYRKQQFLSCRAQHCSSSSSCWRGHCKQSSVHRPAQQVSHSTVELGATSRCWN